MRVRTRTAVLAAMAVLGAWAMPATAVAADAPCPVDAEAAIASFAEPVSDEGEALALLNCEGYLSRERALAMLADTETPSAAALDAMLDAIDDPAETVRRAAIFGLSQHQEAARPLLFQRMISDVRPSRTSPLLLRADHAAAMLDYYGLPDDAPPLNPAQAQRWNWFLDDSADLPKAMPLAAGLDKLSEIVSPYVAVRQRGIEAACQGRDPLGQPNCPTLDPGRLAIAEQSQSDDYGYVFRFVGRRLDSMIARYGQLSGDDTTRGMTRVHTPSWQDPVADDKGNSLQRRWARALRSGKEMSWRALPPEPFNPPAPPPAPVMPPPACCGSSSLPRFPWPAPKPVRQFAIPASAVGGPDATLGQVANRLRGAVRGIHPNFETGLFAGPEDGFVLLARMERIQPDGTPYPTPHRFTTKGNPSIGLLDSIKGLLGERPGHFRIIAFVITRDVEIDAARPVSDIPAPPDGAQTLPAWMANQKLGNRRITALVYAFQRRQGQRQKPWTDGAPSADTHLRKSGISGKLGI